MRNFRIVADSSADLGGMQDSSIASVPLKIITDVREYVDNALVNVQEMVEELAHYKGRSSTACPNTQDYLSAFGEAEEVYCVTITSNLSGSYNAACLAKAEYEARHPGRRVHVIDTLSAGPEEKLIVEKLQELLEKGLDFEEIKESIKQYLSGTRLLFMLESLKNLANNGRVSPIVAAASGLLGIRVVGKASDEGTLEPLDKVRGQKRALQAMVKRMKELGHKGGKVRIAHCFNEEAAQQLRDMILAEFEQAKVEIYRCRALCSFYAEKGGLLMGFETNG